VSASHCRTAGPSSRANLQARKLAGFMILRPAGFMILRLAGLSQGCVLFLLRLLRSSLRQLWSGIRLVRERCATNKCCADMFRWG
jgi:hypothetical protein